MTAYYDSTNEMNFLRDCLNKGTVGENGENTTKTTKQSLKVHLLGIINDVEVCEDEDSLQQLKKSINSSYRSIRQVHFQLLHLKEVHLPTKKIEVQKVYFSPNEKHRRQITSWQNQSGKRRWRLGRIMSNQSSIVLVDST